MELKALQEELAAAAADRDLGPQQNPKNLAMAVAADAGALLALFRWLSDEQSWRVGGEPGRRAAAEALTDLITHALRLADELGVDVEAGICERLPPPAVPPPPTRAEQPVPLAAAGRSTPGARAPALTRAAPEPAALAAPASVEPRAAQPPPGMQPVLETPTPEPPAWLDGLLRPARAEGEIPPPTAVSAASPAMAPEAIAAVPALDATGSVEGVTAAAETRSALSGSPLAPRRAEVDPDAAKALVRSLGKRLGAARSDDPLLRELYDELETLRRTLYSPSPKPSWVIDSLVAIRALLEQSAQHPFGAEIRAGEHLAHVARVLGD